MQALSWLTWLMMAVTQREEGDCLACCSRDEDFMLKAVGGEMTD